MRELIVMTRHPGGTCESPGPASCRCFGWTLWQYWALRDAVLAGVAYHDECRDLSYAEGVGELASLEAKGPWAARPE